MIRLSIIIPFYNVEKYIAQCLDSVFNQDIPEDEYEVICVDDCGSDQSSFIVEKYAALHKNMVVVKNKENRKLGGARNAGLKVARGNYVWYVDSDDLLPHDVCGTFLSVAESNNLDILHFHYVFYDSSGNPTGDVPSESEELCTGTDFVLRNDCSPWYKRCPMAWNRLAKREFYLDNKLWFIEKMMYEDTDLSLYMYPLAKRVKHINKVGYYYRQNDSSVTRKKQTGQVVMYRVAQVQRCLRAYNYAPNSEYRDLVSTHIRNELGVLRNIVKQLDLKNKFEYLCEIRKYPITELKSFSNWRTWLALNYSITMFVR